MAFGVIFQNNAQMERGRGSYDAGGDRVCAELALYTVAAY